MLYPLRFCCLVSCNLFMETRICLDIQIASLLKIPFIDDEFTSNQFSQKVWFFVASAGRYWNWKYHL